MSESLVEPNEVEVAPTTDEVSAVIDLRESDNGVRKLRVSGEIDLAVAPKLHEQLATAITSEADKVIVDLRDVTFIDSTGLGVLLNARQKAHAYAKTFRLQLPVGQARFPFEVTGLTAIFEAD